MGRRGAVEQLPTDGRGVRRSSASSAGCTSAALTETVPQGNLLLDYLVGAHVEFTDAKIGPELDRAASRRRRRSSGAAGRGPYFWDPPRVVPLAAVSYALCMAEIAEQLEAQS